MFFLTGGAGFIGSNFILHCLAEACESVINLDKHNDNLSNLHASKNHERHIFTRGNISDLELVTALLNTHHPHAIVHFAAETHVDHSINNPTAFIETNINGTFSLLQAALQYWSDLREKEKSSFRFLHISTDEVYGSLSENDPPFSETSAYAPNNPYAASKAASDHLVRAYHQTYGLPTLTIHCSNNYGPYQLPEKLIPLMITRALAGKPLPVYGDGQQIRDWLYVGDHCAAIRRVLEVGIPGQTYNVGGGNEKTNLDVVHTICELLDELSPAAHGKSYRTQIVHVTDRLGHDRRYAIDARKIGRELGWRQVETFASGIRKTVQWYLDNPSWVKNVESGHSDGGCGLILRTGAHFIE